VPYAILAVVQTTRNWIVYATNVRNLKKNPSLALRQAEESPVLVLKGNEPNAVIIHLDKTLLDAEHSVRPSLAASLFKDGTLSLGAAGRLSQMAMQEFLTLLSELGIDVVKPDETTGHEISDLDRWLAS
jgi:predicted HTH domain antitoxin